LLALCSSVSAQQRTITISHVKDEPVEIVGLKLKEVSIQPEVSFQAAEGWTKDLEIKIKNVSDEPISFMELILVVDSRTEPDTAAFNAFYSFGAARESNVRLQPNDTVVLRHTQTLGDLSAPGNARIVMRTVMWNGDDSEKWYGGKRLRRIQSEPPDYRPIPTPSSKYRFPKNYQPDVKLIKAVALADPPPTCNEKFDHEWFKYCATYCGAENQYRCWAHMDTFVLSPDPGEILDSRNYLSLWSCQSGCSADRHDAGNGSGQFIRRGRRHLQD